MDTKSNDWQLVGWDWEDGEFTIQLRNGDRFLGLNFNESDEIDWMVNEFEKLVGSDVLIPISDDGEEMGWSGKDHPFQPFEILPEWVINQMSFKEQ